MRFFLTEQLKEGTNSVLNEDFRGSEERPNGEMKDSFTLQVPLKKINLEKVENVSQRQTKKLARKLTNM